MTDHYRASHPTTPLRTPPFGSPAYETLQVWRSTPFPQVWYFGFYFANGFLFV